MELGTITDLGHKFRIDMKGLAELETVDDLKFTIYKSQIALFEALKAKDPNGSYPDNQITVRWWYPWGEHKNATTGSIISGEDTEGAVTYFTSDGNPLDTEGGTNHPDSTKLYDWIELRS